MTTDNDDSSNFRKPSRFTLDELPAGALDALVRNDFATFVQMTFQVLKPNETLLWAACLDLLCASLQDVALGKTPRLIVTIPPRFLKSICGSVALPAFYLGHNPSAEVMCISYSQEIARGFGEDTRRVMTSAMYTSRFSTRLVSERASPHLLKTTAGGARRATSIDGVATGLGGDLLVFDDPQKAGEILSDAIRRSTNAAFENTFLSRQNDPQKTKFVLIMQRLHEEDFVGHVLDLSDDWKLIELPAIAEIDEEHRFETFLGEHIWRRRTGESLHPERFPLEVFMQRRAEVGEAVWATQYQQTPTPAGGGIVNTTWFRRTALADMPARFDRIIQSWDTANTVADWSDYSVCTTWGIQGERVYLLNVLRKRMLYPDLKPAVLDQAGLFGATEVLIENRASGQQLLQDLLRDGFPLARGVDPERDKEMRMSSQTLRLENGFVHVPEDAPWLQEYLHEMAVFPNGKFDDQVDSTSQFFQWHNNVRMEGWNVFEYTRRQAERLERDQPKEVLVAMRPPEGSGCTTVQGGGQEYKIEADGIFDVDPETALGLLAAGWTRVERDAA